MARKWDSLTGAERAEALRLPAREIARRYDVSEGAALKMLAGKRDTWAWARSVERLDRLDAWLQAQYEPVGAVAVAEMLSVNIRTARGCLRQLERDGRAERIHGHTLLWVGSDIHFDTVRNWLRRYGKPATAERIAESTSVPLHIVYRCLARMADRSAAVRSEVWVAL